MNKKDLVLREDVLAEVAKLWERSILAAAELEEAVNRVPTAQSSLDIASLKEVDSTDAPAWLSADNAESWVAGYNAAIAHLRGDNT